jgi:predicted dehydrogenase/threonine dehydrogenase-like Zn-dependent dehydrogenase
LKKIIVKSHGEISLTELPDPGCNEVGIICQPMFSCISAGTETSGIIEARQSLIKTILKTEKLLPVAMRTVLEGRLFDIILRHDSEPLSSFLDIPSGLGYSSSGIIIEKGSEINNVKIGDRIACAGSPHSTLMYVPKNLFVKIPNNVSFEEASFVALGSIAMHGIRRAKPEFGDTFVVIGMGVIGQITAQILNNIGCKVIVTDVIESRLQLAEKLGCNKSVNINKNEPIKIVKEYTRGLGADGVIVCAGSKSSKPLLQALEICRDKGRIVLVGAVPINLPRPLLYKKEIDFFISRSYGPGRYENNYENRGLDYPIEKVRWTENRNMDEFLRLISEKKVDIKSLITHIVPFEKAPDAYNLIINKPDETLGVLLNYKSIKNVVLHQSSPCEGKKLKILNVGVIGSGGFARNTHLPNLRSLDCIKLKTVAAKSRTSALSAKKDFSFEFATNNYKKILNDDKIDLVFITTRHNLHAEMAVEALEQKKHVFVEKPMGLTVKECKEVVEKVKETGMKITVGFNRRFSSLSIKAKRFIQDRKNPIMINYRVVSGFTPTRHWIYDPVEGGGRIVGEVCHFIDLLCWLLDSDPSRIFAEGGTLSHRGTTLHDNLIVTMKFADDSIASLIYGDLGNPKFPKERLEIFAGNITIVIDDFKELKVEGINQPDANLPEIDKGYKTELIEFIKAIQNNTKPLVTAEDGLRATFLCHKIVESLQIGKPVLVKRDYFER